MYKVIIVDDEMIVRHAVKTLIRWEVSRFEYAGSAASGQSALELIRKMGADIVITDIKMPEMDGLALIKRLMADGFDGEVLVLSNYNDFDLVREALKCGAHDYMLKLTLKTDSFMQTLEEMAVKLDAKRERPAAPPAASAGRAEPKERLRALLTGMDAAGPDPSEAVEADEMFGGGRRVYSFIVRLADDEQGRRQAGGFQDTLDKLADGLFPGSLWTHAARTDQRRFLVAAAYAAEQSSAGPEELARRMISLSGMYYNVRISVIYAEAATGAEALAAEMGRSRQAEGMLFYSRPTAGCLSNRTATVDGDEAFRLAEAELRESLRRPSAGAIDLWAESALRLIETAAKRRVHPRTLKRALSGGIWNVANTEELGINSEWDEKIWLERVEAADSEAQLAETIRELAEEAAEAADKFPAPPDAREEVRRALRYLEEHYPERVSIADVAAFVGLSEPYLCQVFKADTGSTILTRLNEIRMAKAYELLASGRYLVKQAAIEVGIPDPFYFNRLFKKRFGIAPKNVKMTEGSGR